jgi:hypothetical protein
VFQEWGIGVKSQHLTFAPSNSSALIEKLTHFPQYLVEFRYLHLSNRVKNEVVFKGEKALRTNEARLSELAAFTIARIQRNRESIVVCAARDLAEDQIGAWEIGNHQSRAALPAISSRKRDDNDLASYRFDHAASSSGELQSRSRTDSLSSAPLNTSSTSSSVSSRVLTSMLLRQRCCPRQLNRISFRPKAEFNVICEKCFAVGQVADISMPREIAVHFCLRSLSSLFNFGRINACTTISSRTSG